MEIKNKNITVTNESDEPVFLHKTKINSIKITTTDLVDWQSPTYSTSHQMSAMQSSTSTPNYSLPDSQTINLIKMGDTTPEIKHTLDSAHIKYKKVFGKDLTGGYNGHFGRHTCHLNWASEQRPEAKKIPIANYNHELKGVLQEVCDELTQQGVLKIPQEHGIKVQAVCPSFLRRKRKARDKALHLLTKDDCRLVVNFNPINEHIKNLPAAMTTVSDILTAGQMEPSHHYRLTERFLPKPYRCRGSTVAGNHDTLLWTTSSSSLGSGIIGSIRGA